MYYTQIRISTKRFFRTDMSVVKVSLYFINLFPQRSPNCSFYPRMLNEFLQPLTSTNITNIILPELQVTDSDDPKE
jgi:hypothetical protein